MLLRFRGVGWMWPYVGVAAAAATTWVPRVFGDHGKIKNGSERGRGPTADFASEPSHFPLTLQNPALPSNGGPPFGDVPFFKGIKLM